MTSPYLVFLAAVLGVAATGVIDYVTGYEVRIFPIYFLPVALVAWRISMSAALAISLLSAVAWGVSNSLAGRDYEGAWVWEVNLTTQFIAFAVVGVLVAELQRRLRLERELSRVDPLTRLANARAFYERGEILVALARRSRRPITLAYLDLDDFKSVNDQRGHAEGDLALTRTAAALLAHCRSTDLVARLGGDEFAVLLPDTGLDGARVILERFRGAVAAMMKTHAYPCAVSIGAVSYTRGPSTLEAAVQDADELMYRAKGAGKDRVLIEELEAPPSATASIPTNP